MNSQPSAPPDHRDAEIDSQKEARNHAWSWFALHANQRMQTFNYFLIATAFLFAAYGALLDKNRVAAVGVAILGAWLSFWFNRLDRRTRQLVNAGEDRAPFLNSRPHGGTSGSWRPCRKRLERTTEVGHAKLERLSRSGMMRSTPLRDQSQQVSRTKLPETAPCAPPSACVQA